MSVPPLLRIAIAVAVLGACGGEDEPDGLGSAPVDCSADDAVCDEIEDARCSVRLREIDETGEPGGICGGGTDRRACTITCEVDGDCPEGWACELPVGCPGEGTVRYCLPAVTTLASQGIEGCLAEASPRVCGF